MTDEGQDLSEDVAAQSFGGAFVEEAAQEIIALPEFDPQWREPLNGLLFIGNLTMEFRWPGPTGHKFKIKTIDTDTYLKAGLFAKKYEGTFGDMRAYQSALVAGCLVSVDDKPVPVPAFLSEDDFDSKLNFFLKNYSWTVDAVYNQFCVLESVVAQVIEELGKASGAPSATGMSSLDSDSQNVAGYLAVVDPSITYKS